MITLKEIQTRIAEAIKQSGLTQTALAEKLSIRQHTISCDINGNKMPVLDAFANFALFGMSTLPKFSELIVATN